MYLIHRGEVCACQHQPASTSLFPQNGCFHPSNYLRSFDWNVGTQVLPPKFTLHFQDTLYNQDLEFVISKSRIKLHKFFFFLNVDLDRFSPCYPWLPVGCLPLFLLKWQKEREELLTSMFESRVRLQRMRRWEGGNSGGKQKKRHYFANQNKCLINLWLLSPSYLWGLKFGRIPFLRLIVHNLKIRNERKLLFI